MNLVQRIATPPDLSMEGEDAAEDDAEYGQEVRHGMATRKRARTTTTNGVTEVKK